MSERFDGLTEAIASSSSRRDVLKAFGAAAVAGVTATILKPFRASAVVVCGGPAVVGSSPCSAGTTPCGQCCCRAGTACTNASRGVCGCPAGTTPCGNTCCKAGVACGNASTGTCNGAAAACLNGDVPAGNTCATPGPCGCTSGRTCRSDSSGESCPGTNSGSCFCWTRAEGGFVCGSFAETSTCKTDADCGSGFACVICARDGGCGCATTGRACTPLCNCA